MAAPERSSWASQLIVDNVRERMALFQQWLEAKGLCARSGVASARRIQFYLSTLKL